MTDIIRRKTTGEAWETVADTGGGAPSGAAGGVLAGTYPNPTIPGLTTDPATGAITNLMTGDGDTLLIKDSANVRKFHINVNAAGVTDVDIGDPADPTTQLGVGAFDIIYSSTVPSLEINNISNGLVFIADRHDSPIVAVSGDGEIGLFGTTPVGQPTVAGVLSAVVDPNVKTILTSLIAALATAAGVGLVADGTT